MVVSLHEKIQAIYPQLTDADFCPPRLIVLQDDNDGRGAYIAKWEHPTLPQPAQEQLDGLVA